MDQRLTYVALVFILALAFSSSELVAQESNETNQSVGAQLALKEKYHAVEVRDFAVMEGVDFPAEYVQSLRDELVKEFAKSPKFLRVQPAQEPAAGSQPVLILTGTVVFYEKGSRGKRYLGFGMGAAHAVIQVALADRATGQTLLTEQIVTALSGGAFGGDAKGITHDFGKTCVETMELLLEKPVPVDGGPQSSVGDDLLKAKVAEQVVVTVDRDHIEQGEAELNAKASTGYRIVGLTPKGAHVDVAMEPSSTYPQAYQYRVLHVHSPANLQKDLNKIALDGFRYCPHTLAWLTGGFGFALAIAEKPPSVGASYTYRLHEPLHLSNAQKDVANDQRENFNLVGTLKINTMYVVLLEKPTQLGLASRPNW